MSDSTLTPLKVAVVGHTNTGKTSLMRTLMRDVSFGEVSDRPATTRHVEGAAVFVRGQPLIELYDTPGMEDSIALLDALALLRSDRRADGVSVIQAFLDSPEAAAGGRFAQEAKALRQLLASDIALYVIDARDRVLGKHRDELEILSWCARPVVPALNFIASPEARTAEWRDQLSRVNLHAVAEFDTVVLDETGEQRLYEKMRTLLDRHHRTLDALIQQRKTERQRLTAASARLIADMLIDVAAHAVTVSLDQHANTSAAVDDLRQRVRQREQQCVTDLLELHRFRAEDCAADDLPVAGGQWGYDLFSPAAMKQAGVRTGSAAAAGALAGLTIDAALHGLSLGAGAALGAAIGAAVGAGQLHGRRLVDRMRGRTELRCDDATVRLLLVRQVWLVRSLLRRGHASVVPIRLPEQERSSLKSLARLKPPPAVLEARTHPQWSRLTQANAPSPGSFAEQTRTNAVDMLTADIRRFVESGQGSGIRD
jgi:GTPase SAR1 family protein